MKLISSPYWLRLRSAWISGAVVLFLLALAGGPLAAAPKAGQGSPVAAVNQPTHDFGEVYEGEHISHTFTVRNNGSAPLELRDPAAKAQNREGEPDGFVAAPVTREKRVRINGLAVPVIPLATFSGRAVAGPTMSLLSAAGRRVAPS